MGNSIVKKIRFRNFNLTEALYAARLRQARHRHEPPSMSFVVAGSYTENYEKKLRICRPQTMIIHPPHESHAVDFHEKPVRILNVEFADDYLARLEEFSKTMETASACRAATVAALGRRLFREFSQPDELTPLAVEALVLEILVEASRADKRVKERKSPCWLASVRDCLHDRFAEAVALEELAALAGVHPVHLARVFRRQFGCTTGEYVRTLRVEYARRQLSTTATPLCEIALSAGFSDQSHFNKTFKGVLGLTPNEYRKLNRKS